MIFFPAVVPVVFLVTRPCLQLRESIIRRNNHGLYYTIINRNNTPTSTTWLVVLFFRYLSVIIYLVYFLLNSLSSFSSDFLSIICAVILLFCSITFIIFHFFSIRFRFSFSHPAHDFPVFFFLFVLWAFFCTYEYMLYENRTRLFLNLLLLLKQKRAHPACYVYSMLSSNIFHSTAQQRNQPCTKQRSTYVPIRV